MVDHRQLVRAAQRAVAALFADNSVPRAQTWTDLADLRDTINMMLESLPSD